MAAGISLWLSTGASARLPALHELHFRGRAMPLPDKPPCPLAATLRDTIAERRQHRLRLGPCSACNHHQVSVMLRTEYVLHLRCDGCLSIRTVMKPGFEKR